jgi:hypothetical protein
MSACEQLELQGWQRSDTGHMEHHHAEGSSRLGTTEIGTAPTIVLVLQSERSAPGSLCACPCDTDNRAEHELESRS